jgi:hypothetical protein
MTKKSEIYRTLLRRQAEQLQKIARSFRDPRVRDRVERLALDIVGGNDGQQRQESLN